MVTCDVLGQLDDDVLVKELESRELSGIPDPRASKAMLEKVWLHFRDRPHDAPECLRDYLWAVLGRTL